MYRVKRIEGKLQVTSCKFQAYSFGGRGLIHQTRQRIKKQHGADESAPYARFVEIT